MFSMESADLTVPTHLQDLFDKSVAQGDLAPTHQSNLAALLRRHSDAFATGPMDLGYCSVLEDDIDTGDAEPIRQPPRRPPLSARQAEEDILNEMLQTGVIEPSNSPWSSPVCMVRKKDGSYRYCVDYRRMNSVTIKDAFPVPDVKDALDKGPVHTRIKDPSRLVPRFVHKRRVSADDTIPWMITTFRSPIVVELKDLASGRKQIVHVDRIVPCLDQETETEVEVVEQMTQSPLPIVPNTQPTPSYLAEHQASTES